MQIYSLLKDDHRKIKEILSDLSTTTDRAKEKRPELLSKLKHLLIPHSRAEEIVLYDELKLLRREVAVDHAYEGYEEHRLADHILSELEILEPSDPRWRAKFEVLKKTLTTHIDDEEEVAFEQARLVFDIEEAEQMAYNFRELKKQFAQSLPMQDDVENLDLRPQLGDWNLESGKMELEVGD